jgi:hypothetical protein
MNAILTMPVRVVAAAIVALSIGLLLAGISFLEYDWSLNDAH